MNRDLDIDFEEPIDSNFKESIEGVTSKIILEKIKYLELLHTFKFNNKLTNTQVNTARFMMEGIGLSPKYWLCIGLKTLNSIIKYNMKDDHYNELIKVSGRKDVLCLRGLPLFYSVEPSLGDCLLLVSDIKKRKVRVSSFLNTGAVKKILISKAFPKLIHKKDKKPIEDCNNVNITPNNIPDDDILF